MRGSSLAIALGLALAGCAASPALMVVDPLLDRGIGRDLGGLREEAAELSRRLNDQLRKTPDFAQVTVVATMDRAYDADFGKHTYVVAAGRLADRAADDRLRAAIAALAGTEAKVAVNTSQVEYASGKKRYRFND
jgi:hypothetical protein